ncbi:toxic anion resistance protein [Flexivirga endophytica]|uniref:Toxic anion resistance protein n=1 Tax=Flexivirga endophytica TaxID=1849103 RepID=A0A916T7L5_9MICO|nr:toxic anion resistance protein [Flexivirga endophytica]GGB32258.1 toxic anion resistance protein [Flexivirga endophytica]GHB53176.1 toxic anion resistance protein [Flexivirga endophytica]
MSNLDLSGGLGDQFQQNNGGQQQSPTPQQQPAAPQQQQAPAPTAPAPAPNVPPVAAPASTGLVLEAPSAVPVIQDQQAVQAVPVAPEAQTELDKKAHAFVTELTSMDMKAPSFTDKVNSIVNMGDSEIRRTSDVSNRMLQRPAAQAGKDSAQSKVGGTLVDLRRTITDLDPNRADLKGAKKILKWLPGGNKIENYFMKYQSAQSHLDAIIRSLAAGQDELRKDNASIEVERNNMWQAMQKLGEYNQLATALDGAVEGKIAELSAAGRTEDSDILKSDVLFAVRQRRQDIMTQMAVSVQGYLALDLVRKNNQELIRGVDRAQTTTVAALRTAIIVSQALAQQKVVLDQITALNSTTSTMIEETSKQLRTQGTEINKQAASSTIEIDKLQAAFDNVFATMDEIDKFRSEATVSMSQTIGALEGQVQRAKPYLERSMRSQGIDAKTAASFEPTGGNQQLPGGQQ